MTIKHTDIFTNFYFSLSSQAIEYEEEYEDVTVKQMLAPKSHETLDTTEILNNLLREYDRKLRPDIGGKSLSFHSQKVRPMCCYV